MIPSEFWTLTPWQMGVVLKAEELERRDRHDRMAWLAYHTAVLGRIKTMPPLRQLQCRSGEKDVAARLKATLKSTLPIKRN